ncbi:hypothetical protein PENSPDRAFT_14238 [Peniophora sp. CONT]|nr:hypothetical protein PENSPDRAFT_14238 [Peniophora sp. CONT]
MSATPSQQPSASGPIDPKGHGRAHKSTAPADIRLDGKRPHTLTRVEGYKLDAGQLAELSDMINGTAPHDESEVPRLLHAPELPIDAKSTTSVSPQLKKDASSSTASKKARSLRAASPITVLQLNDDKPKPQPFSPVKRNHDVLEEDDAKGQRAKRVRRGAVDHI